MSFYQLLMVIVWSISVIYTLYAGYQLFTVLFSLHKKTPVLPTAVDRYRRFLILVAARNEEAVIGSLIRSLHQQNYPADKITILVIPNNCTDDTRGLALREGAQVMDCLVPVKSKGDVFNHVFERLLADPDHDFDAYCVFDADNLVHPDYLAGMNRALCAGANVVQGYRDSKNPSDTWISGSTSIYFWYLNFFYNRARNVLGLSATLGGSGFVISDPWIREFGGWHTEGMIEDMEFSAQCVLSGEIIQYQADAVFYDEQPLTFAQSWTQRMRWTIGMWGLFRSHTQVFAKRLLRERKWLYLDQILFLLVPASQIVYMGTQALYVLLIALGVQQYPFLFNNVYALLILFLPVTCLMISLLATLVVFVSRKPVFRSIKGILGMGLFLFSWMPILVLAMFRKNTTWDVIGHTRSMEVKDVRSPFPKKSD